MINANSKKSIILALVCLFGFLIQNHKCQISQHARFDDLEHQVANNDDANSLDKSDEVMLKQYLVKAMHDKYEKFGASSEESSDENELEKRALLRAGKRGLMRAGKRGLMRAGKRALMRAGKRALLRAG